MARNLCFILLSFILCQCSQHPKPIPKLNGLTKPYHYQTKSPYVKWHYPELNWLIKRAFQHNPGLTQTQERLKQAEFNVAISRAALLPLSSAGLSRTVTRGPARVGDRYALTTNTGLEIDFSGKNRLNHQQNKALVKASKYDVEQNKINLIAAISTHWIRYAAFSEEEQLLNRQINTNKTIAELQRKRYENGLARALDVLQQQENVANSKSLLPPVQANRATTKHALAVLIGQSPNQALTLKQKRLPALPSLPKAGIPINLIQQRPDVQAAYQRFVAADYYQQSQHRSLLPSFNLSANLLADAVRLNQLIDNWILQLISNISQPIFNGGALIAQAGIAKSVYKENEAIYVETLLNAIKEVQDSLANEFYFKKSQRALKAQLDAAKDALTQAQFSYSNGDSEYLNVLTILARTQALERQLLANKRDQALNRITLMQRLGGPWPTIRRHHANA